MRTMRFVNYQDEDLWVGWLEEFPDCRTQGESLDELKENLRDRYEELASGAISCVQRVDELVV